MLPPKKNLSRFCMSEANLQNRGSSIFHEIKDFGKTGKIVIAAAPRLRRGFGGQAPPFRIFAGGLPRRLRRRKRFGLIQVFCTTLEKSMPRPAFGGSRRPNRTEFSGQKEIPDSIRSRKEKF